MNDLPIYWQTGVYGAALTTIRVGGAVQYVAIPRTIEELINTVKLAESKELVFKVIGGGSNILFADKGYEGVVIRPKFSQIDVLGPTEASKLSEISREYDASFQEGRYQNEEGQNFLRLDKQERPLSANSERSFVEVGAGVPWGQLVSWTLAHNLTGLEYFARIPCYTGGAVFNNIHGEKHLLSECICGVRVYDYKAGQEILLSQSEMNFDYDSSILHTKPYILTSVIFSLRVGTKEEAGQAADLYKEWCMAKGEVQPTLPSAGSVFQNLSKEEAGDRPVSAAWYIDKAGFKGMNRGGMQVYSKHANFIVNTGEGTQADFLALVRQIRQEVYKVFGVSLHPEVECIDSKGKRII